MMKLKNKNKRYLKNKKIIDHNYNNDYKKNILSKMFSNLRKLLFDKLN